LRFLNKLLDGRSRTELIALGLALVVFIGVLDNLTGYELSFSIFYLVPIVNVTWYVHRRAGLVLSLISVIVWTVANYRAGHSYGSSFMFIWNGCAHLGFFLFTVYLVSELRTHLTREAALARVDSLTQLLNARAFRDVSKALARLAARHRRPMALAYIDIDDFKGVNDGEGHSAGDRLLQKVGRVLARSLRSSDVVGRLGGDEFAVCMPETDYAGARMAFAKIHADLVRKTAHSGLFVGFSIGVAVFPEGPRDFDEALDVADRLMYRVKTVGKNDVICEEQAPTGNAAQPDAVDGSSGPAC
jgi:diguanylate cyclase (GGDEF)-like protein